MWDKIVLSMAFMEHLKFGLPGVERDHVVSKRI
jgi:hypothetical protein